MQRFGCQLPLNSKEEEEEEVSPPGHFTAHKVSRDLDMPRR